MTADTPIIKVDGTALPSPSEYAVTKSELTQASRNALGTLYKYHLGWKRTLTATWYAVTREQMASIDAATGSSAAMAVVYYDPASGTTASGSFYRGSDYAVEGVGGFTWRTEGSGDAAHRVPTGHRWYKVTMSLVEY